MDHSEETPVLEDDEKLQKYLTDLSKDAEVIDDQRVAANEDMRFVNVDGGMWEGDFEDLGNRVKLELDMCSAYVNRFKGEWTLNRVGVEFEPDDSETGDEDGHFIRCSHHPAEGSGASGFRVVKPRNRRNSLTKRKVRPILCGPWPTTRPASRKSGRRIGR